ncbi:MAG TPA: hypothetical protein VFK13_12715 [Gemmatimonadaceae bacterium]|nr:hypothetical protein [Gemmatimonadaceae bacterium]
MAERFGFHLPTRSELMKRLALAAVILTVAIACKPKDENAAMDTAAPAMAPAPATTDTAMHDTTMMHDTTDTSQAH